MRLRSNANKINSKTLEFNNSSVGKEKALYPVVYA